MPRLEFNGGKSPWDNIERFVTRLKKKYPGITPEQIQQAVTKATLAQDQRLENNGRVITMFGMDIMTDHPEDLPIWPTLAPSHQQRILEHPVVGGASHLDAEDPKYAQLELAGRLDHGSINRIILVSPRGMEQTYVWSSRTDWIQEVTRKDYDLLLSTQGLSRLFQDPDEVGHYTPVRSFQGNVLEKHVAKDRSDVKALVKQYSRQKQFAGADVRE